MDGTVSGGEQQRVLVCQLRRIDMVLVPCLLSRVMRVLLLLRLLLRVVEVVRVSRDGLAQQHL